MLEPLQPETELPVNINVPDNVKPSDALSDAQIKAKIQAPAPTAAEARAALERMVNGENPPQEVAPQADAQPQVEAQGQPTPAESQPAEQVEVPQKFQTPDGKLDAEKLAKATLSADAAIKLYNEKEAEMRRKMNEVHKLGQQAQAPAPVQQTPANNLPQGITPEQVEESIKKNGAGWTLLKLAEIAKQEAAAEANARVAAIEQRDQQKAAEAELREIGKADPWVFTPHGMDYLYQLREQYPELNASKSPMQAAYDKHLAIEVKKSRQAGQVQTPTPAPMTAKAPPTPVNGARPVSAPSAVNIKDDNAVNAHAKTLPLKEQLAFMENVLAQRGVRITRK